MAKLLVVDDEPIICHSFRRAFAGHDVEVLTADTLAEGRSQVMQRQPDVIVLDLQLPDGSGLDLLRWIVTTDPRRPVIIITAHGTTETAIEAMKHGAFDYLLKPLELEKITQLLGRAFEAARLMKVPAVLPDEATGERILGRSLVIQEMSKAIGRVAPTDATVLITGESGTGKELVARAIYHHSRRADRPFLALNCAALPEALVESELFGHEQGAFTGADRRRIGKFEQCNEGTLLLDEIGDMSMAVQAKMLRLLQEQRFERVGGSQTLTTKIRILAATNKDLETLITEGRFRADLYYRLKVVTIHVPPLRERSEDIPELAHHFLYQFARDLELDIRGFAPEVLDAFQHYPWPGNVRQLQGVIKESMLRTTGHVILTEFLSPELLAETARTTTRPSSETPAGPDLGGTIEAFLDDGRMDVYSRILAVVERELLVRTLRHTHGHQANASEILGINRTTLRNKLRDLGIGLDKIVTGSPQSEEA
jgi:two-component system nitrogen regulation response regulator GlnG